MLTRLVCFLSVFPLLLLGQRTETVFFRAILSPANEVPPVNINATGTATIRAHVVRNASGEIISGSVDFIVSYSLPGAASFTGLHIHRGRAGENGPVTINAGIGGAAGNLEDPSGRGTIERQAQVFPGDGNGLATLQGMLEDPSAYYVNLHTTAHPGGVLRAQLQRPQIITLLGAMSPRNEVPPILTSDASGVGAITVMRTVDSNGKMDSALVIFDVDYVFPNPTTLTGLHVHAGPRGVNGPVTINSGLTSLATPPTARGRLLYSVEVDLSRPAQAETVNGLFIDPESYYVNLHTTEAPGGLVRSQLRRTDEMRFQMELSPRNEVPPVNLEGSGPSNVVVQSLRGDDGEIQIARVTFDINYRLPGASTFIGLHVHNQVAGQNGPVTIDSGMTSATPVVSDSGFGNIYRQVNVSTPVGITTLNSLVARPEQHYVNLHSTAHPGGVLRAQVGEAFPRPPAVGDALSIVVDPGQRNVAPGGLISLFGERFAHVPTDTFSMPGLRLPLSLNGVEVNIGGRPAPLLMVSEGRIDAQVPFEVTPGTRPVVVTNPAGSSAGFNVEVAPVAPALYRLDQQIAQAIRVADFVFITLDNPATAEDVLAVWATGLGQTMPPLQTGVSIPDDGLFFVPQAVTATVGARSATVLGAGAAPGLPGSYIVAIRVPAGLAAGLHPLQIRVGTSSSNTVMLPVR
ncbi:MAG: CHRD domain-containing protein [Bryobacteraceae bacterium]|nr:CHRD domain-containing protein [Bryobacteraceae bacterium]MDW8379390.1 CHRD domain-containing protein [Bryobacterales bacterium]